MSEHGQEAYRAFIASERRILGRPTTCWERSKNNVLRSVTLISLLASLGFFLVTGYLIWATVERSLVLFLMAVFFFMEMLCFAKYFVDMIMLKREKARWHLARVWVPLVDLVSVLIAAFFESLLLPCGVLADFWHQAGTLDTIYFWMTIQCMVTLIIKLLSTIFLTAIHVRTIKRLLAAKYRVLDPSNFGFTRDIELQVPSAPPHEDSNSV